MVGADCCKGARYLGIRSELEKNNASINKLVVNQKVTDKNSITPAMILILEMIHRVSWILFARTPPSAHPAQGNTTKGRRYKINALALYAAREWHMEAILTRN